MSDKFHPTELRKLTKLILSSENQILGIDKQFWFKPENHNKFSLEQFSQKLDNPVGVAAGPHTQLAQNIVASWLCGARYIELKTIQTLDELEVDKPCIDMQDEGYNCEWSQELKVHQSFDEYLNAWILIHILNHKLNGSTENGTIFNMSVGYNMEGILKENVQWFFNKMKNASAELQAKIDEIKDLYPEIENIKIPSQISDNITLSTMHGCPANEIEEIGLYLINEKKLNTLIKLNPTLLGAKELRKILNEKLMFETAVPDQAFEHDLKYTDAISIIQNLQAAAEKQNVFFGLKLTNTLENNNIKSVFTGDMMYMSGRALHPISINVVRKLQNEFKGELNISFSGGADAFNVADILACGISTVTVSSDLLKPGGYLRLKQYFTNLETNFEKISSHSSRESALKYLNKYAGNVTDNERYQNLRFTKPSIKTEKKLTEFDCISAPCMGTCPTQQDIPSYMYYTALGQFDKAFAEIIKTNPFPNSTGMVCDHLCQTKCTRINYDQPLLIREVKRFVSEQITEELLPAKEKTNGQKVAIIGAGPSGLSAAYFLLLAGFEVNVYEQNPKAGGMVQSAIPDFRLKTESLQADIDRIIKLGAKINYNYKVDKTNFELLRKQNNFVYISVGAQKSKRLNIEGIDAENVFEPLQFLFDVKSGKIKNIGKKIGVIGGGNTAMDTVRTANRLAGKDGKAVLIYRRSMKQMPAEQEEIQAVIDEGIEILELTSPEKVIEENGKIKALQVSKMKLGETGTDSRRKVNKIPNSEFEIELDALIPAIGQDLDIDFVDSTKVKIKKNSYQTALDGVFIGGDAMRGAANLINAIADGKKVAYEIIASALEIGSATTKTTKKDFAPSKKTYSESELKLKKATREFAQEVIETEQRNDFGLIIKTLEAESAKKEAARCLQCDEICDVCTSVCPNLANYSYRIEPQNFKLPVVEYKNKETGIISEERIKFEQAHQILNIRDWCNECGNCNTFCPTAGAPYKEKPHLHLSQKSYNSEAEGYILSNLQGKKVLLHKFGEIDDPSTESLSFYHGIYTYENEMFVAKFKEENFELTGIDFKLPHTQTVSFKRAAKMKILMEAAKEFESL